MSRRSGILPRFTFLSALTTAGIIILIALIAYGVGRLTAPAKMQYLDQRTPAPQIKAHVAINKLYTFSVKDDKGVVLTKINYTIESADLEDQIIIRGQQAQAIKGKTFLVINFSLTNTSSKYIQMNSRDYVRLVDANGQLVAPDIHNDPIQIQPISTKESRLGFPVDDSVKKFTLSVGEIDGKKSQIPVNF